MQQGVKESIDSNPLSSRRVTTEHEVEGLTEQELESDLSSPRLPSSKQLTEVQNRLPSNVKRRLVKAENRLKSQVSQSNNLRQSQHFASTSSDYPRI